MHVYTNYTDELTHLSGSFYFKKHKCFCLIFIHFYFPTVPCTGANVLQRFSRSHHRLWHHERGPFLSTVEEINTARTLPCTAVIFQGFCNSLRISAWGAAKHPGVIMHVTPMLKSPILTIYVFKKKSEGVVWPSHCEFTALFCCEHFVASQQQEVELTTYLIIKFPHWSDKKDTRVEKLPSIFQLPLLK